MKAFCNTCKSIFRSSSSYCKGNRLNEGENKVKYPVMNDRAYLFPPVRHVHFKLDDCEKGVIPEENFESTIALTTAVAIYDDSEVDVKREVSDPRTVAGVVVIVLFLVCLLYIFLSDYLRVPFSPFGTKS